VIERYFELAQRGATIGGEVRGGLTTFVVMAYIIFVSPARALPSRRFRRPPVSSSVI